MSGWWAASYVVLWGLVLVLCVIVVALARQVGALHLRLGPRGALELDEEGPPLGEAPEPVDATDLSGRAVTIGGPGESQLLLFVSPGCRLCDEVLPGLPVIARRTDMAAYVVTGLDAAETKSRFGGKPLGTSVVAGKLTAQAYAIPGTPYAVALDERGVVRAKGTVNSLEQLEGLVETAARRIEGTPAHPSAV